MLFLQSGRVVRWREVLERAHVLLDGAPESVKAALVMNSGLKSPQDAEPAISGYPHCNFEPRARLRGLTLSTGVVFSLPIIAGVARSIRPKAVRIRNDIGRGFWPGAFPADPVFFD